MTNLTGADAFRREMFDLSNEYADFLKTAGTDPTIWTPDQTALSNKILDDINTASASYDKLAAQGNSIRSTFSTISDQKTAYSLTDIENAKNTADQLFQQAADMRTLGASESDIAQIELRAFAANATWENMTSNSTPQSDTTIPATYSTSSSDPSISSSIINSSSISSINGNINNGILPANPLTDLASGLNGVASNITQIGNQAINSISGLAGSLFGGNSSTGFQGSGTSGSYGMGGDPRIRIRLKTANYPGILAPLKDTNGMIFPFTPNITLTQNTNYTQLATTHGIQDYHLFHTNVATQITIDGPFTAQNKREGEYMLACIHFLETMNKMRFGQNNPGFPPPVLILSGYGNYMFNDLPVIITSMSVPLLNNVDYLEVVKDGGWADLPTLTNISVTLIVQNTPKKNRTFDWDKFASGELMKAGAGFI